jgi:hypothetical protein
MALARLAFRFLLVLLILLAVIGLALPSSVRVEREIVIQAPVEQVFPHVNSMRRFHAWSPWTATDPSTTYVFEGPEVGVGSRLRWFNVDESVGAGSQEITLSRHNAEVQTSLIFGDQGSGTATFLLEDEGNETRVRWQFITDFGWDLFGRYVGLMLDSMIGGAYQRGLRTLKQQLEGTSSPTPPA